MASADSIATMDTQVRSDRSRSKSTEKQTLRIVLPAYNEAVGIAEMLDAFQAHLTNQRFQVDVTVVDDGSSDGTAEVVQNIATDFPVRLLRHRENRGLAAALRTGLEAASQASRGDDLILTMDSDNTHPVGLIPRMVQHINEGHDVVIASRFQRGARVVGVPWFRRLTGRAVGAMFKVLFPIKGVRDYTCGFRVYRSPVLRQAFREFGPQFISEQGFSCMVDVLLKLSWQNLSMSELPMVLRYDLKDGASKMQVGSTIIATLQLALKRRMGKRN